MSFSLIDIDHWDRKEYFHHYFSTIPCTYSMTTDLDITELVQKKHKLYPAMIYSITTVVNRHPEFRTAVNKNGELGIFSEMVPCYTIFHKDSETFSNIWTEYHKNYDLFCQAYQQDLSLYGNQHGMIGKPNVPENHFPISMIPWVTFEGFHLNLQKGYEYLLPIFTMGKYHSDNNRILLPFAVQVHHAVCDGFHVSRLINELQELLKHSDF